jgi:hypothetical protein
VDGLGFYASSYVTIVACAEKCLQIHMGRVGLEPTPWRLKVRTDEARRAAANGKMLHFTQILTAPNCSQLKGLETNLYARSYAR